MTSESMENNETVSFARRTLHKRWVKAAAAVVGGLLVLNASTFTVEPSERANVRRLNNVVYDTPLKQGLHFKIPLIDTVDRIEVSLNTHELGNIDVGTIDNQRATITTNYVYDVPDDAVNQLLYRTGATGSGGIEDQVEKTVRSVAVGVFAKQNMNSVNQNLGEISAQIQKEVSDQLMTLYRIEVKNFQIENVRPSDTFLTSNEEAVKSKNAAIAAENQLRTVQFQAQQAAAKAKGEADAQIEKARGEAEAVRLAADADKTRLILLGQGEQLRLQSEINALGNSDIYVKYLIAKQGLNWKGDVPQVVAGQGTNPNLVVPLPPAYSMPGNSAPAVAPR